MNDSLCKFQFPRRSSSSLVALVLLVFLPSLLVPVLLGQLPTAVPRNRIHGPIVNSDAVTLAGNVHPLARPELDRGPVSDDLRLDRMVLLLAPEASQQRALDALTEAQQQPASPSFHQWLSPEDYGRRFGASAEDIAQIAAWLTGQGFQIDDIPASHRLILFSGTAAQVADAFHTGIHRFDVAGEMHMANTQDPQIPRALASVVSGILSLHDFRRTSAMRSKKPIAEPARVNDGRIAVSGIAKPENSQGNTHYLLPADFATIYDLNPPYAAGETGAGVSIAIVGRSNINLSDVSAFRSFAALAANQPTVILVGSNPGLVSGDQDESTLDVEWSGATAPGAAVNFVVGASTATTDGVDLSAQYIVNHNVAPVMSTSYGSCEAYMGSAEMAFYNSLWQQAASEGISSFVSSGDSGAAGCNGGGSSSGSMTGVNGLCSSPYSTCVGGTEFNEGSGDDWSSTNGAGGESALGYISEKVWNESADQGGSGLWASGGGASTYYVQPSWQTGVAGANHNGMRLVPDVAVSAASHDGYIINENGSFWVIAGTSAASPSYAGILAVVVQKQGGAGQGNANPGLYAMLNASQSPFHATPSGSNTVPGVTGFTASGSAYNLATGLGSVDANLLVNVWASGSGGVTKGFTLKASAATESLLPGKSATFTVAVSGTGGFTGTAALKASLPSGVSLSFTPASVKAGGSATATLTVSTAAPAGTSNITITGTSGGIVATTTVALTVQAAPKLAVSLSVAKLTVVRGQSSTLNVTTTASGTFAGTIALSVTGMPAGVTATLSPPSFAANGAGSTLSTLTLKATTAAALASGTLTVKAAGDGLTAQATSTVQVTAAPSMTLSLSPNAISMKSTASQQVIVTATPTGGADLPVSATPTSFQIAGLPTGVSSSWGSASLNAAGALQVALNISGSNGAVTTSTKPTITVKLTDADTGVLYTATAQVSLSITRTTATQPVPIPH
jgi:subtilase family serine protease